MSIQWERARLAAFLMELVLLAIAVPLNLSGALIGAAGTLRYVALTRGKPEPWPYLLAKALKVVGGAMGGVMPARRRPPAIFNAGPSN